MKRTPNRIRFTKQGLEATKQEYEVLLASRKPAVATLKAARELGDLSENGLYTAAKANLRSIDSRLRRLSAMVKLADVYEAPKNAVGIGSKVLTKRGNKEIEYEIVGDYEADPANHKISANSPIGRALVGKKLNDEVRIQTPNGETILKILQIQ